MQHQVTQQITNTNSYQVLLTKPTDHLLTFSAAHKYQNIHFVEKKYDAVFFIMKFRITTFWE